MSTMVTLWAHMGVTTISGGESQEVEQSLPILGLLIHEHITVHEIVPHLPNFVVISTMVTLWAHMGVTTFSGRSPKKSSSHCRFLDS